MTADGPLRIDADIAIYLEGGIAKFRPPHRDRDKVFQAVLRWQDEHEKHPRRAFAEEWIQSFELTERKVRSIAVASGIEKELQSAKSIGQFKDIIARYKMKSGIPEAQAHSEAASIVKRLVEDAKKGMPA